MIHRHHISLFCLICVSKLVFLCNAVVLSRVYRSGAIKLSDTTMFYHDVSPSADVAHFALLVNDSNQVTTGGNWLGIGIGETASGSMLGSDIVTAEFDPNVLDECTITDRYVPHVGTPLLQPPVVYPYADDCAESDWVLVGCMRDPVEGIMLLEVRRPLSVIDERQDRVITSGPTAILYAYGDRFGYHGMFRGATEVTLFSDNNADAPPTGLPKDVNGHVEVRARTFLIPPRDVTHACTSVEFQFENDAPRTIVAVEPVINDKTNTFVQHMSLFLCSGSQYASATKQSTICDDREPFGPLGNAAAECSALVYTYSVGGLRMEFPIDAGLVIDVERPYLVLETLYRNPTKVNNTFDTSGVRIYYSNKTRKHEVGSLMLGDPLLSREGQRVESKMRYQHTCPNKCTSTFSSPINVLSFSSYMRSAGKSIYTNRFDLGGKYISTINQIHFWSESFQHNMKFNPPLRIFPGQQLQTTCEYNVSKRAGTKFGLSRNDELCLSILTYWPAQRNSRTGRDTNVCGFMQDKSDQAEGFTLCGDIRDMEDLFSSQNDFTRLPNPAFNDTVGADTDFGKESLVCTVLPTPKTTPSGTDAQDSSTTDTTASDPENESSSTEDASSSIEEQSSIDGDATESAGPSVLPESAATPDATAIPDEDLESRRRRSCFPAYETLQLRNGKTVRMDQLKIGDEVAVGQGVYSKVFMFTHANPRARSQFIEITSNLNTSLTLSPGHVLPVNGKLTFAKHVKIGDSIKLVSTGRAVHVTATTTKWSSGLYNPQTLDGNIAVNGIVTTTFTEAVEPITATAFLAPLRWVFITIGTDFSFLLA